jgi:hypothetical protein
MTDEECVRQRFSRIVIARQMRKPIRLYSPYWRQHAFSDWQAARAFTEAREEEIRQVEEEIALLNLEFWEMHGEIRLATMVEQYTPLVRELCRWARILAREQAALTELKRGMK